MTINDVTEAAHINELVAESSQRPVMIFKHSTRCGISFEAESQFERFVAAHPELAYWKVLVVEDRPLSQQIAKTVGTPHTSPQILLVTGGKTVFDTSHYDITVDNLEAALAALPPAARGA